MRYSLTRATLWNLAGYLYLLVASFISTPILLHNLGLTQFSQYSLIIASLTFVSSLNLGLPQAVVRALSRHHTYSRYRQAVWATSSLLFILTGLAAGSTAVILTAWLHLDSPILWLVFAIGLTNNLVSHYLTLPQAEGHFGYFNSKTFVIGTGNTLLAAYLAWKGQGIMAILAVQLLTYLLTLLPLLSFSLKFFPHPHAGKISPAISHSLLIFGLKSWVGKLVGQIQAQYAKYLLVTISPLSLSLRT